MHLTLLTGGTRGDVQPFVALGARLRKEGFETTLIAPEDYSDLAAAHGVPILALPFNMEASMQIESVLAASDRGRNPFKLMAAIREIVESSVRGASDTIEAGLGHTDAVVCHVMTEFAGRLLSDARNIPMIRVSPVPVFPTRAHAFAAFGGASFGSWPNYASAVLFAFLYQRIFAPVTKSLRRDAGLPVESVFRTMRKSAKFPTLAAFSETIYPRPADFPPHVHTTGFWFLDEMDWRPSQDLLDFLDAGPPPLYVGFGSMNVRDPDRVTAAVVEAVVQSGERAVLYSGWGAFGEADLPACIKRVSAVPHDWLFPRMKAAIHHGGAGTTAAALRAGLPMTIVPFFANQPFWGRLVHAAGLGPECIPQDRISAARLRDAIRAMNEPDTRHRARRIADRIGREDGTGTAGRVLRDILTAARASHPRISTPGLSAR